MKMFLAIANVHRKGEVETLINAPTPDHAHDRISHAVKTGLLVLRSETIDHAGNIITVVNTFDGILNSSEVHELYRYPNAHTNFFGRSYNRAPRYNPRKTALNRLNTLRNQDSLDAVSAISEGWNAATKAFSSRAKSPDAKLKSALKSYTGNKPEDFKHGFLKQWLRLTTRLATKPKKTTKKRPQPIPA